MLIFYLWQKRIKRSLELSISESVCIGRNIIRINAVSYNDIRWNNSRKEEYICGDKITWPLEVRTWKHGDRFVPLGLKGVQKLSDYFINQKVPRHQKDDIPLICNKGGIVWLAGYRLDDRYKVTENCKRIYKLTIENNVN
jgi:tRNA(Ile)-lysidine synthase